MLRREIRFESRAFDGNEQRLRAAIRSTHGMKPKRCLPIAKRVGDPLTHPQCIACNGNPACTALAAPRCGLFDHGIHSDGVYRIGRRETSLVHQAHTSGIAA